MRVLLTRPLADSERFAARLRRDGVETIIAPLLRVKSLPGARPDLDGVQALLFTSANGVRAYAEFSDCRDVRVLAVGPSTAGQAREEGFGDVLVAGGDAGHLTELAVRCLKPGDGALLHVAGSVQAGDLSGPLQQGGFTVNRLVAYSATKVDRLPDEARAALRDGILDGAVFFSPRTSATFATLVAEAELEACIAPLTAFCLSQAVAEALGSLRWKATSVAQQPEGDMLARLICFSQETS